MILIVPLWMALAILLFTRPIEGLKTVFACPSARLSALEDCVPPGG